MNKVMLTTLASSMLFCNVYSMDHGNRIKYINTMYAIVQYEAKITKKLDNKNHKQLLSITNEYDKKVQMIKNEATRRELIIQKVAPLYETLADIDDTYGKPVVAKHINWMIKRLETKQNEETDELKKQYKAKTRALLDRRRATWNL
jgi:hypothetical protein